MKIFVIGEYISEKIEIGIFENQSLKINREHIFDMLKEKKIVIKSYFQIIFGNLILNDENKFLSFYKIYGQNEIWIGRVEKFMQQDDVIVELFVTGFSPSLFHFIVNKNISIFNLKSMVKEIIPNFINVWDLKGNEMRDDQIISEIDLIGGFYKLIIRRDDDKIQTFDYHSKLYDQYLASSIFEKFQYLSAFEEKIESKKLILLVDKCRKILSLSLPNFTDYPMLDTNLSEFPVSYVNSLFLFTMDIANRIWEDCCEVFWNIMIDNFLLRKENRLSKNFRLLLCLIIVHYVKSRQKFTDIIDKSIRNILIDTLEHFANFLIDDRKDECYVLKLFSKYFLIGSYDNMAFRKLGEAWIMKRKIFHVKVGNAQYNVILDISPAEKIIDVKKAIWQQTNISVDKLFCVQYGSNEQPKDDSIVGYYPNYFFEVLMDINSFKDMKKLGGGGFGEIYLCRNEHSNTEIVLKKPYGKNKDEMESLYRDISINSLFRYLTSLERYVNLVLENETVCLVMNYLSGGSLSTHIKKAKVLKEIEIGKICFQLLNQIKNIHALNIIHRDINCDNIVLDQHGNARLIDYGISKCINETSTAQLQEDLSKNFVGNPRYCSPEYLNAEPYTKKVDIWSLGAVVITMATGTQPYFKNSDIVASINIKKNKTIKYDSSKLSLQLVDFINLCLTANPDDRPSADELIHSEFIQNYLMERSK